MSSLDFKLLYAQVPEANCRGLCTKSCSFILLQQTEYRRIERHHPIAETPDRSCPMLEDGRCKAYEDRPLICRLYGVAEGLLCPYGCKPEKVLSYEEAHALINAGRAIDPVTRSLDAQMDRDLVGL